MIYCSYKRADGTGCMNEVEKAGELCVNHQKITTEEIKAIRSVKEKLDDEEFISELHLNQPRKIIKIYEEVLLDDYERLKRLRKTVDEEQTVSNNLTKLSESVAKRLMKFLEVSNLSEMEKMPDISELFDIVIEQAEEDNIRETKKLIKEIKEYEMDNKKKKKKKDKKD